MKIILLALCLLSLSGCRYWVVQVLSEDKHYKKKSEIRVGRKTTEGIHVVDMPENRIIDDLRFYHGGDMDFGFVNSCLREKEVEDEDNRWHYDWKISDKEYKAMETGFCPLWLKTLEQEGGRHGFGLLLVRHPSYNLPFKVECNAEMEQSKGLWGCQAREGLPQYIEFNVEVFWEKDRWSCPSLLTSDEKSFEIPGIMAGECVYTFLSKEDKPRKGQVYMFGYNGLVILELKR